jgi:hypothetical protein
VEVAARLAELGYEARSTEAWEPIASIIEFQLRNGLVVSGRSDAETVRLLSSAHAQPGTSLSGTYSAFSATEVSRYAPLLIEARGAEELDRRRILSEALVATSGRFVDIVREARDVSQAPDLHAIYDLTQDIYTQWLAGTVLSLRADEPARRATAGYYLVAIRAPIGVLRLAVKPLLGLPRDDPQRNDQLIELVLGRCLSEHTGRDLEALILADLIESGVGSAEQQQQWLIRAESLAPGHEHERALRVGVANRMIQQAILARDAGRGEAQRFWAERSKVVLEGTPNLDDDAALLGMRAVSEDLAGRPERAAELFADFGRRMLNAEGKRLAAVNELRYRRKAGEWARAIEVITPHVESLEADYLTAVQRADVEESGRALTNALGTLAMAQATQQRWSECLGTVDRMKSRRFRFRSDIRKSTAGRDALRLEEALTATALGLTDEAASPEPGDVTAGAIAPLARVQERYRTLVSDHRDIERRLDARELASRLEEHDALIALAMLDEGTIVQIVEAWNVAGPSISEIIPAFSLKRWFDEFGMNELGWLYALGAPDADIDRRAALGHALRAVEEALAPLIRRLRSWRSVTRVFIAGHQLLHLIPFAAVPCFEDLAVVMLPSAEQLPSANRIPRLAGRALIAVDPTGDLPLSLVEEQSIASRSRALGLTPKSLLRSQAIESSLMAELETAALFHFSGHGRSELTRPERSALLCWPVLDPLWPADPFEPWADAISNWQSFDSEERRGVVPGVGVLTENRTADAPVLERFLDRGATQTLFGRYWKGRLTKLAELTTANDIALAKPLDGCGLVFLSACEAGNLFFGARDEYAGMPASFLLAGAGTVISPMWPVTEVVASVFVDWFYRELSQHCGRIDVARIVRMVQDQMRSARRDRVVECLSAMTRRLPLDEGVARFMLEAATYEIAHGPERPFSHPYDWSAFQVYGRATVVKEAYGSR